MSERERPGRDRLAITQEAGFRRVSLLSVVAGTLTGYGAFALVAAVAGAVLSAANVDTDFETNDWTGSGAVGGLVTALVLLTAYLFGGYVAGRMARRSGLLHGVLVFILSLVGGAIVGAVVGGLSDDDALTDNLSSIGIPTSTDDLTGVAVVSAIVSVAAMLIGAILGAKLGERWHTKLARRAADPDYGSSAAARRDADRADDERDRVVSRDEPVRRQAPSNHDQPPPARPRSNQDAPVQRQAPTTTVGDDRQPSGSSEQWWDPPAPGSGPTDGR